MELVAQRDARGLTANASVFWTKNTSSTWHLKTPTVKSTSLRSSLLMVWGKFVDS